MNEREEIIELYDLYKDILTVKQQKYFEEYYFEDLSLQEVSDNSNVSKTIVAKTLKTIQNKLISLEQKIHLKKIRDIVHSSKNEKMINEIDNIIYKAGE